MECHAPFACKPTESAAYYNFKGFTSLTMLALVDHLYRFRYILCGKFFNIFLLLVCLVLTIYVSITNLILFCLQLCQAVGGINSSLAKADWRMIFNMENLVEEAMSRLVAGCSESLFWEILVLLPPLTWSPLLIIEL